MRFKNSGLELVPRSPDDPGAMGCLQAIYVDVDRKRAIASNGKIVAVVPVEPDKGDMSGYVTVDQFKTARRVSKKQAGRIGDPSPVMKLDGAVGYVNGMSEPRADFGKFPDIAAVTPKHAGKATISLDAELLRNLARAINTRPAKGFEGRVTLWIDGATKAVYVKPFEGDEGSYGVIMPLQVKR